MPMTSPTTFLAVDASPIHPATTTAAISGVVEFRMAASEAVRSSCEVAMSVNAAAAFKARGPGTPSIATGAPGGGLR